jgi:TPR repeat protein
VNHDGGVVKGVAAQLLTHLRHGRSTALRRKAERQFAKGDNAGAVASLLALGEAADAAAHLKLGGCYEFGVGVIRNFASAARWYERAAEKGSPEAMAKLGDFYFSGRIIHPAADLDPASAGRESAASGANRLRPNGLSVRQNFVKAAYWNDRAARLGDCGAQARLATQYATGKGVGIDFKKAETWFLASAQKGNPSGQLGLAVLHASGNLGDVNDILAAHWFEQAAAQGDVHAKLCLAVALIEGRGIAANPPRAAALLLQAATKNHTEAMFRLGEFYLNGPDKDLIAAETWLRRAASRAHQKARLALAKLELDELPSPDRASTDMLFRQATEPGGAQLQYGLGRGSV